MIKVEHIPLNIESSLSVGILLDVAGNIISNDVRDRVDIDSVDLLKLLQIIGAETFLAKTLLTIGSLQKRKKRH